MALMKACKRAFPERSSLLTPVRYEIAFGTSYDKVHVHTTSSTCTSCSYLQTRTLLHAPSSCSGLQIFRVDVQVQCEEIDAFPVSVKAYRVIGLRTGSGLRCAYRLDSLLCRPVLSMQECNCSSFATELTTNTDVFHRTQTCRALRTAKSQQNCIWTLVMNLLGG